MELLKGTLDILVLKALSWGPLHGYGVSRWIRQTTGDVLQVEEGALYPALRRMERKGWLEARWGVTETNREARFYTLTAEGGRRLEAGVRDWGRYADAMARVLYATTPAG